MTVEKAVDRFLEDFDHLAYSYFGISVSGEGSKSFSGVTLGLTPMERELGLELLLRLKSSLGSWVSKANIYMRRSTSPSSIYYSENVSKKTVTIIVTTQESFMRDTKEESKETISVLNFLKDNIALVYEYIDKAIELREPISYSGMLRVTVDGTTREGVNLRSRKVERSRVTQFIEEVANGYRGNREQR